MKSCWPAPTAGGGGGGWGMTVHAVTATTGWKHKTATGRVWRSSRNRMSAVPSWILDLTWGCGDGRHGYTAGAKDVLTPAGVSLQICPLIPQTSLQDSLLPSSSGVSIHQLLLAVYQLSPHLFWVLNCAKVALFPPLLLLLVFVFLLGLLQSPEEACRDA